MFYVICNPSSRTGKGQLIWNKVKGILEQENVEYRIYHTSPERNGTVIAKAVLSKVTGDDIKLMVLGGDGSVNEVLQGFTDRDFERVKLVYLPTGSSNDLARDTGYVDDLEANVKRLIKSDEYKLMDIGELVYNKAETLGYTKRLFAVSCGMGFDASVCYEALNSKAKTNLNKLGLGKLSYMYICLKQLFSVPLADLKLTLDDNEPVEYEKCFFAAVMNHRFQGGGIMFCPDAVDNDGVLDICFASKLSRFKILSILPLCYKGGHVGKKGIGIDKCKKIRIESNIPMYVHTDGEVKTMATDVTISCLPSKLKFMI